MSDVAIIQDQPIKKKLHRMMIGGVWHVLVMVGYHRGWPEWHWIKEDEYLRSLDK